MRSWVALVKCPARRWDAQSDALWSVPGVLGVEEIPHEKGSFFVPEAEFEILEFGSEAALRCAEWLERDSFRQGREVCARVYVDQPEAEAGLRAIEGLDFLDFREIPDRDYFEEYKKGVLGVSFGEGLWVGPPWREPPPSTLAFVVEPGLAFGTGDHPTTQICLEFLHALSRDSAFARPEAIADIGTGSGILALAARRFFPGASLWVCDLDPLCKDEVEKTFRLNQASTEGLHAYFGPQGTAASLRSRTPPLPLLLSNIYAEVLTKILPDIAALVRPGGLWIASGILEGESEKVLIASLPSQGFRVQERRLRTLKRPRLDSRDGFQESEETWVGYVFAKT
jgi:ribosomal protein L11 methyltransferase